MLDKDALDQEMEKQISEMEATGYVFPKRFSRQDYLFVIVTALICLIGTVAGLFV